MITSQARHPTRLMYKLVALILLAPWTLGCGSGAERSVAVLTIYNAASITRPLRAALDSFAAREHVNIDQESGGSLETARKLTELGRVPDVIALADDEIFPKLLVPAHTTWYAQFAHNRMVLAHTARSRFAAEVTGDNWWRILQRPGVEVGRSDPDLDPGGYRALLVLQLAERFYEQPGLARRLLAVMPTRNVRPEGELIGLLQVGELDYVWTYESVARAARTPYVRLPDAIDLSAPGQADAYAHAAVDVAGRTPRDTVHVRGRPIVYALSIPTRAPHRALAERFVRFLLSPDGKRILRANRLDVLDHVIVQGTGAPGVVADSVIDTSK